MGDLRITDPGAMAPVAASMALLFFIALFGSVIAAVFALRHPAVGGLDGLLANPDVAERLAFFQNAAV